MSNRVLDLLLSLLIPNQLFEHPPLYTVDDITKFASNVPGINNKNLFLKDKKGKHHLIVFVPEDKRIDLKAFSKTLGLQNLSFASDDKMKKMLEVTAGAVSPLAVVNDIEKKVRVVFDKTFEEAPSDILVQCHPLVNSQTVVLSLGDMYRFIKATEHQVEFSDIPSLLN